MVWLSIAQLPLLRRATPLGFQTGAWLGQISPEAGRPLIEILCMDYFGAQGG